MLLLRYKGQMIDSNIDHDLEVSHEESINVLRLEIINKENPDDPILFDIDINEIEGFYNFIKQVSWDMRDIEESEERI